MHLEVFLRRAGPALQGPFNIGGEGEIRTPEALASLPVFKTGAFNRSATSPSFVKSQTQAVFCRRCVALCEAEASVLFPP